MKTKGRGRFGTRGARDKPLFAAGLDVAHVIPAVHGFYRSIALSPPG